MARLGGTQTLFNSCYNTPHNGTAGGGGGGGQLGVPQTRYTGIGALQGRLHSQESRYQPSAGCLEDSHNNEEIKQDGGGAMMPGGGQGIGFGGVNGENGVPTHWQRSPAHGGQKKVESFRERFKSVDNNKHNSNSAMKMGFR